MRYFYLKPVRPKQTSGTPILSVIPGSLTLDRTAPGNATSFTASLNLDSGSAVPVTVASSDPSVTLSPTSFALGGGNPLSRAVTVTGAIAGPDSVTITVSAPGQSTQTIAVSRPPVPLDLTVSPTSLVLDRVTPGNTGTVTATLNRVPETALQVDVVSSDPSVTASPASFSLSTGNPPSRVITLTGASTGPNAVTISVNPLNLTSRPVSITRPAFVPSHLSGLALWLDASDTSTVTMDASNNVSQWNDKSGNARDANQTTTANMPVYVTNSLNGLAGIRVTTGRRLQLTSRYTQIGDFTIFRVTRMNAGGVLLIWHDNTTSGPTNTVALSPLYWSGWPGFFSPLVGASMPNLTTALFNGPSALTFRRSGTAGTFRIDSSTTTRTLATTSLAIDFVAGGMQTNVASDYVVYETLIYNRGLSDTECDTVMGYLKTKWATP